jgi:hypothetical protein
MYKIIGGDGNEYGPVPAETLRQWIQEGRLNARTKVCREGGTEWMPLGSLQDFADVFQAIPPRIPPTIGAVPVIAAARWGDLHEGDYELDIGSCVKRGYEVFKPNMGDLIASVLLCVFIGISPWIVGAVIRTLSAVPGVGMVFYVVGGLVSLATVVIGGPLLGGMYSAFLKAQRQQRVEPMRDVFSGFSGRFWQLFLGYFIPALFVRLCLIPSFVIFLITLMPIIASHPQEPPITAVVPLAVSILLTLPIVIWLSVNWQFTLPLIIDKRLDFWTAMKTSWRQVSRHWWTVFGLSVVIGLINVAGMMLCCIGLLFSAPVGISAFMQAYDTLFTPRSPKSGQAA